MQKQKVIDLLNFPVENIFACGSRIVCNPPALNTGEDWMLLIKKHHEYIVYLKLKELNFSICSFHFAENENNKFCYFSYKRGLLNILVTYDIHFYLKFFLATKLAKRKNLLDKNDRIKLFQVVLYDNYN